MNNIFCTSNKIDYRFDLKGSTCGRKTHFPEGKERDNTIALKDLDFLEGKHKFKVGGDHKENLMKIIREDAKFFAKQGIIDYSLLIGIHERPKKQAISQIV